MHDNNYQSEPVKNAFRVWYFLYGMGNAPTIELVSNPIICSGFTWVSAENEGYIAHDEHGYRLTPLAIAYIKRINNEHRTNETDEATPCECVA